MATFAHSSLRHSSYPRRPQSQHRASIITLLTDFGLEDVYAGVMKGVIAGIVPQGTVVDLTHHVPPQNIALGSFHLGNAYAHFPPSTIHVAVVDPGVGSTRRAVAIQTHAGTFVGPDNGLFSQVLMQVDAIAAVELSNRQYWYVEDPSHTFHGRDIFAPVAAYLAKGLPLQKLGPEIELSSLQILDSFQAWQPSPEGGVGTIQAIDHFGNLITTIPASSIKHDSWSLQVNQSPIPMAHSYIENSHSPLIALIGSHGWIEIACPSGSAQNLLQLNLGDCVQLQWHI